MDDLVTSIRRRLNIDTSRGVLGNGSGNPYDVDGKVWVRFKVGDTFGKPVSIRNLATVQMREGNAVVVGLDDDGEPAVLRPDITGQLLGGFNPIGNNPAADVAYRALRTENILTSLCYPTSPASMKVGVKSWIFNLNGVVYRFTGGLTGTIAAPTAGDHYLAGVFIKTDLTLQVVYSASQSELIDLDETDIQELLTARAPGAYPVWAWRIPGGLTTGILQEHSYIDLRQFINVSEVKLSSAVVSTPPTNAELNTIFGTAQLNGAVGFVDSGGVGTQVHMAARVGGDWWLGSLQKAV